MSTTDLPEDSKPKRKGDSSATPAPRSRTRSGGGGPMKFIDDVRLEMKKVSWPTRAEVTSTTVVVLIACLFFSVYLWGVDSLLGLFFGQLESWLSG